MGAGACHPASPLLPGRFRDVPCPHSRLSQSLGDSKLKTKPFCSKVLRDASPFRGLCGGHPCCPPCLPLPGHPPDWHWEHLSGGGAPFAAAAEQRCSTSSWFPSLSP